MQVFKFFKFNSNNLDAILNGKIWLSSPTQFNDPYDAQLRFKSDYDEEFLNSIAKYIFGKKRNFKYFNSDTLKILWGRPLDETNGIRNYSLPALSTSFYGAIDDFKLDVDDFIKFLFSQHKQSEIRTFLTTYVGLGIVCFGNKGSNPNMWAHYADNHQGFCVMYELNEDDLDRKFHLRKVQYQDYALEESYVSSAFPLEVVLDQLSSKSTIWDKEDELRIITIIGGGDRLIELPMKISAICYGLKMPQHEQKIIENLFWNNKTINFCRAVKHRDSLKIKWHSMDSLDDLEV